MCVYVCVFVWFVVETVRYSFFRQVITYTLPMSGCNAAAADASACATGAVSAAAVL